MDLFYLYCKIPDILRQWRNFGSILFVLFLELFLFTKYKYLSFFLCIFTCTQKLPQRSHTFLKRIYFICTANYTKGLSIYDGLLMMSGLHRLWCFFVPPIFESWVWFIATKYLRPSVQKESIKLFFKWYFNNYSIITNELSNSWIKST